MVNLTLATIGAGPETTTDQGSMSGQSRSVTTLSDGRTVHAIVRGGSAVIIYEVNAQKTTRTQQADLTEAQVSGGSSGIRQVSVCAYPDNSVAVMTLARNGNLAYRRLSPSWAWSSQEIINTTDASVIGADLATHDLGRAAVSYSLKYANSARNAVFKIRNAAGNWVNGDSKAVDAKDAALGCDATSVAFVGAIGTGSARLLWAVGSGQFSSDNGIELHSCSVATNGSVSGMTKRITVGKSMADSTKNSNRHGRLALLFAKGDSWWLAFAHTTKNRTFGLSFGTWLSGSWGVVSSQTFNASPASISRPSVSFSNGKFTYAFIINSNSGSQVGNYILNPELGSVNMTLYRFMEGETFKSVRGIGSSSSVVAPDSIIAGSDFTVYALARGNQAQWISVSAKVPMPDIPSPIVSVSPQVNEQIKTTRPRIQVDIRFDTALNQSKYRFEFRAALDSGFTTNVVYENSPLSNIAGTSRARTASILHTLVQNLPGGIVYWQVRLANEYGHVSAWSTLRSNLVVHIPVVTPVSPASGSILSNEGNGILFDWNFSDPSPIDEQKSFEFNLWRLNSSGSQVSIHTVTVETDETAYYYVFPTPVSEISNQTLYWSISVRDLSDNLSAVAGPLSFTLTEAPVVEIISPTDGSTVDTGVPRFEFRVTSSGDRATISNSVTVYDGSKVVWSQTRQGNWVSGTVFDAKVPNNFLENNKVYSYEVKVTNDYNIIKNSGRIYFTVAWVPPLSASGGIVDVILYNVEDEGYALLSWDDENRDEDHVSWIVYRKDDELDPNTNTVIKEGEYKKIYIEYDTGELYYFKDFFVGAGTRATYAVTQYVNRDGQELESDIVSLVECYPVSDGYWLIEPLSDNTDADAFKLSIVTADSFTDEVEESEYIIAGRGRMVSKGEKLGYKGTLDVQIRDSILSTARQKKQRLEMIKESKTQLWLRNPYGDIFRVNVSNLSISRIAGVGRSEFCDVSIPYTQVGRRA